MPKQVYKITDGVADLWTLADGTRSSKYGKCTRYKIRWWAPDGTHPSKAFDHHGEAARYLREVKRAKDRGEYVDTNDPTKMREWYPLWLRHRTSGGLATPISAGTAKGHKSRWDTWIGPRFGSRQVVKITRTEVAEFLEHVRANVSPEVLSLIRWELWSLFEFWREEKGSALPNPVPPRNRLVKSRAHIRPPAPTDGQVRAVRDRMPPDARAAFDWEHYSGNRYTEALGAREQDITWCGREVPQSPHPWPDNCRYLISAPLDAAELLRISELDADEYEQYEVRMWTHRRINEDRQPVRTKTLRAVRYLPLDRTIAETLARHLLDWPAIDGWLFTGTYGPGGWHPLPVSQRRPIHPHTYYQEWYLRAVRQAGVILPPRQGTHWLRHHRVSALRDAGLSEDKIAQWIGCTVESLTANYGAPPDDSLERTMRELRRAQVASLRDRPYSA